MSRSILGNEFNRVTIQEADDYFSEQYIFKNREDAAKRLADKLKFLVKPASKLIILAIPRGGVVTGDVIASSLGAKLDIVVLTVRYRIQPRYQVINYSLLAATGNMH